MLWLAAAYGAILGIAQFYLVKAVVRTALTRGGSKAKVPWRLALWLAVYMAGALGAVYLFETRLVAVAAGLGVAFLGTAAVWLYRKIKKMK